MTSSSEHQEILGEIRQVRIDLVRHIEEDHDYMPADQIRGILDAQSTILGNQTEMLETMKRQQEIIADVVLGERHETYDGEIERKGGLADALNGVGFKIKIPWGKIIALIATIITVGGAILVAIIETRGIGG